MSRMAEDLTFALQYGALGLSLGVYLGHSATNWLWRRRVEDMKLERVEDLFNPSKKLSPSEEMLRERCTCGHVRMDHDLVGKPITRGACLSAAAGKVCKCKKFDLDWADKRAPTKEAQ